MEVIKLDFQKYDREKLISDFNLSEEYLRVAEEEIKPINLEDMYNIYCNEYYDKLVSLQKEIRSEFFDDYPTDCKIHSIRTRVKDPYHFLDKLVRKMSKNTKNYKGINNTNFITYFNDLIGFRFLMIYSDDWENIHKFIVNKFPLESKKYLNKGYEIGLYGDGPFIMEQPVINIRKGDDKDIYKKYISEKEQDNPIAINEERYYRSIHYIVYYKGYSFEIQVRSIFDEGWGEVDHDLLYPLYLQETSLISFSKLLNRIAGTANEMCSYFKEIHKRTPISHVAPNLLTVPDERLSDYSKNKSIDSSSFNVLDKNNDIEKNYKTASDIINQLLKE